MMSSSVSSHINRPSPKKLLLFGLRKHNPALNV